METSKVSVDQAENLIAVNNEDDYAKSENLVPIYVNTKKPFDAKTVWIQAWTRGLITASTNLTVQVCGSEKISIID